MAADHQRAPCSCPESGCASVGSPAMLLDHFAAGHQRPAVTVRYGQSSNLGFSLSHPWHVIVGEEDRSVFLLSLGALGAATAVWLVCVRPDGEAEAASLFWCKLSVEPPGSDMVLMTTPVSSSTLATGAPSPSQGMFLAVPRDLLSGNTLTLSVRIDLIPHAAGVPTGHEAEEDVLNEDSGVPRKPSDLYSSDDPNYTEFMEGPKEPSKANSEKNNEDKDDDKEDEEEDEKDNNDQLTVNGKRPHRDEGPEGASKKKKD